MHAIAKGFRLLDGGLLWGAGIGLAFIFAAIIYDVILRNLGFQPPGFTLAVTEYGMLFITMAVAPLLVRKGEHVSVAILSGVLAPDRRRILAKFVQVVCAALCLGLAWFAFSAAVEASARGEVDIRSIDMPRWILYSVLGSGLSLSGLEFLLLLSMKGELSGDPRANPGSP